ncbi:exported protein of unknown function [Nitrospira moscoviensis]|uniref:Uncharacterized protein n=1 Tax=Nitrospira moscoviensis TaxID=42253 RepID=A0A0K2GBH9_NITMO|nr:exported protein of unknown function [Nitrospira moscoviensis]
MKRRGPARSGLFLLTVVSLACAKPGDVTQAWLGHGAGELANVWGQAGEASLIRGAHHDHPMTTPADVVRFRRRTALPAHGSGPVTERSRREDRTLTCNDRRTSLS